MWYFSWILGLGLACAFSILNAMWFELRVVRAQQDNQLATSEISAADE
ncbi:cytochrome bd-I oxidase subunit CydX [Paenalcaligenes niemegkensis]|nr:cytochrome bd-I oxidase subunit CydX [Paenalcaligenes niemegkensis]MCQ9615556.1 cytochrome bd-I oxidase subunit CydX [Paenalcaligenes niemegkensis]